jgi:hypothetical protein
MNRRLFLALWLPLLVALFAVVYKTSLPNLVRQRLSCEFTESSLSSSNCPDPIGSWGDENGQHRWFDADGVPVSYQTYQNLRGPFPPKPKDRSTLYKFGARVACWPSTGGIWIKHAVPIEMAFLEVSQMYDTHRPTPLDPAEEDAFCTKMRLIGAEFWENSTILADLGCAPFEKCVSPQIRNDLGITWLHGDSKGEGGAHLVNLTQARIHEKLGPGLRGYYQAPSMEERYGISWSLGGINCRFDPLGCKKLWCAQYHDYCDEAIYLSNDDILWDCKRKEKGFC